MSDCKHDMPYGNCCQIPMDNSPSAVLVKKPLTMVKLDGSIQLIPKEYRLKLADIAAQLHATGNYTFETSVLDARELLYVAGITEALVPKQHADSLAPGADADDERKAKALDCLYPPEATE